MEHSLDKDSQLISTLSPRKGVETSINSSDGIDMISHGSEFTINIMTPVGMKFMSKTKFIGYHSNNLILLEIPDISDDKIEAFFQEGFWMNVRAISQKGEGGIIQFRSQIMHILCGEIPMIVISVPGLMKLRQLRKEPRYEVSLTGYAIVNGKKVETEIRDLSKGGCRFIIAALAKQIDIGEEIQIDIFTDSKKKQNLLSLSGRLCNLQSSLHYSKYGLKFDHAGQDNVKTLLTNMKFNGTKFVLKSEIAP